MFTRGSQEGQNGNSAENDTITSAQIAVLRAGFDYYVDYSHGSPSPAYYWFRKRQKVLRLIHKHAPSLLTSGGPTWKFADLGCGDGTDLFLIRKRILELVANSTWHGEALPASSRQFIGADGNPASMKLCALKRIHYGAADTQLFTYDLTTHLPFSSGELNLVYCSEVLEHLTNPEGFLGEVRRVLSTDGHLLITTPNEPNLFQRSFWNCTRRCKIREDILNRPTKVTNEAGESIVLYGHVSLRNVSEWDTVLLSAGFEFVDAERGALLYAVPPRLNGELAFGLQLGMEALLDLLPVSWVRSVSDQVIGLFRRIK